MAGGSMEESNSKIMNKEQKDVDGEGTMKDDSEEEGEMEDAGSSETNNGEKDIEDKKPPETTSKKKTTNWPVRDIKEPSPNDVLFGRGGGTNHHPGNKRYRKMVEDRKLDYVNSKRLDKPLVALDIIRTWRTQDPPGRFLKLDEKTGLWQDVGDKKAREKTSQALREKAPLIRKQQEEEKSAKEKEEKSVDSQDDEPESEPQTKTTRFAEGTNEEKKGVKRAVLARDHSLGREYLQVGEAVSLDGFSWQDPIESGERVTSHGSAPPPPPSHSYPSGRTGSHGSVGVPPPDFRIQSHGSIGGLSGPPAPPDFYGRIPSGDYFRSYSNSHFESWGPMSSFGSASMPPPPPPLPGYPSHGSWTQHDASMSREHSLSGNHLRDASISHPAPQAAFDSRTSSGYWGDPSLPQHGPHVPPPPPPPHHGPPTHYSPRDGPPAFRSSNGVGNPYGHSPPGPSYQTANALQPPSPPYQVDPAIAKTWSGGQEIKASESFESYGKIRYEPPNPVACPNYEGMDDSELPRPCIVKRATSNQNETLETKKDLKGPSIKRAALNRDNSEASNRLKEKYVPGYKEANGRFDPVKEMNMLSDNLEQSTLSTSQQQKPKPLRSEQRISTLDHIAMDLMSRPVTLTASSRSSTIEALALEFADDPVLDPVSLERSSTLGSFSADIKEGLPRPSCLNSDGRLSTMDFLQIINEPLGDEADNEYMEKPFDFMAESSGAGECFTSV